ncbi:MAG: OmpA family protein, partial [Myxococcota bacterium]
ARIDIKIHDQMGFWQTVELVPFTVDIPHDEVNFDSGKATFAASEEGKLEKTYVLLSQELEKHGSDLEISLYIAGYTDTVGPARANIGLSTSRARAIAAWFRKRGIRIPIYYQGFGESVLAVQTADNVDEKRNRRALYILGNQKPLRSAQLPRSDWKLLR